MHPFLEDYKIALIKTNPCKKCLVKPICSEVCSESKKYKKVLGHHDPLMVRLLTWTLFIVVFIEVPFVFLSIAFK